MSEPYDDWFGPPNDRDPDGEPPSDMTEVAVFLVLILIVLFLLGH